METFALFVILMFAVWQFEKMKDQVKILHERQESYARMISTLQAKVGKLEAQRGGANQGMSSESSM